MRDSAAINTAFGMILGFIYSKGDVRTFNFWKNYKNLSFYKKLLRIFALIIVMILPAIILVLPILRDVALFSYAQNTLGFLLAGFFLIKYVPIMYRKMDCDVEGDFFKAS